MWGMFLRRNRKRKNGQEYEYWTLVKTVRTARGPRQQIVASLGKLPGLDEEERIGWEEIGRLLDGHPQTTSKAAASGHISADPPHWAHVDVSRIRVERVRDFGQVYVGLALWRQLGFHEFFSQEIPRGRELVDWATISCILSLGRFCNQGSELALVERWYSKTALDDLLGVSCQDIYDNRLYRCLDQMLPLRGKLFLHLRNRYESLFGSRFEFLLYDVTSTYFEGQCEKNLQAQRGYSRDQRFDCKQICLGLVVTPEGLPLAYEIFPGNRADVTTVEQIVMLMEEKYGKASRIWMMDRGMTSEENLEFLRDREAMYIVGTPKAQLRKFEKALLEQADWKQVRPGVEVKLVSHPDGLGQEQYVLCRSQARHEKESAMLRNQRNRLREKLTQIDASLRKKGANPVHIERKVEKWLGRNTAAEKIFNVEVLVEKGKAVGLHFEEKNTHLDWANHAHGAYLLRTNCLEEDPQKLWTWYMQLTQVEDAFRSSKSDLGLRPVYHQLEHRVQAHVMVCFIALTLWRCFEMWLQDAGLGNCARQALKELNTIRSLDVILPIKNKADIRLRVVSKPEKLAHDLLCRLKLKIPSKPKIIKNVVENLGV